MYSSVITKVEEGSVDKKLDRGFEGDSEFVGVGQGASSKSLSGKQIHAELEQLRALLPFDSRILGKKLEFQVPKRKRKRKKKYDLNKFRVEVNKIAQIN